MTFDDLATVLLKIEETPSRLQMTEILSELFTKLDNDEITQTVYLMQGRLVPAYKSLEFQLSEKMLLRALARILSQQDSSTGEVRNLFGETDLSSYEVKVKDLYKQKGDLGETSELIINNISNVSNEKLENLLTITEVFDKLTAIAKEEGQGSQERKVAGVVDLLKRVSPLSARYIIRIILGKLRLGFSTMTIIDALSWQATGGKTLSKSLELAYNRKADVGVLAREFLAFSKTRKVSKENIQDFINRYNVELGTPVVPALCQRLQTAEEIVKKMETVIVEPKYDGIRIQIHVDKAKRESPITAYTRNLEEVSYMFPELEELSKSLSCQNCILDAELIGISPETAEMVPFQVTVTRKRKHGIEKAAKELPVLFRVFDLIYLEDQALIDENLQKRKELLENLFAENEYIKIAPYLVSNNAAEIQKFHETQLHEGLEGAVVKKLDSHYVSGRKGWNWVKIKEHAGTVGKLTDTLDLIVMGYYLGKGKRAAFGMGALLVGLLDDSNDEGKIVTIAKIGTGMSEEQLQSIAAQLQEFRVQEKPKAYVLAKDLTPDSWVEPSMVIEVAADEITKSPIHSAGSALRFPRLISIRQDKSWQEATTLSELSSIQVAR